MEAVSSTKLSNPSDKRVRGGEEKDGLTNQDSTCTVALVSVLASTEERVCGERMCFPSSH